MYKSWRNFLLRQISCTFNHGAGIACLCKLKKVSLSFFSPANFCQPRSSSGAAATWLMNPPRLIQSSNYPPRRRLWLEKRAPARRERQVCLENKWAQNLAASVLESARSVIRNTFHFTSYRSNWKLEIQFEYHYSFIAGNLYLKLAASARIEFIHSVKEKVKRLFYTCTLGSKRQGICFLLFLHNL